MPLANTFTLLEKIVLSSAQSQVTFMTSGNISSNYTDLVVMMSVRSSTTSGNSNLLMWLNGVTGTSYSYYQGFGDGNGNQTRAVLSSQPWFELSPIIPNANGSFSASTFANCQVWIQDYRRADGDGTAINSLFYSESNVTSVLTGTLTGTFANTTNPITSITIDGTDNFVAGSTFYLYGIANTTKTNTGPSATGGNTIATDGTYWYHAFTSSGTFTPTKALTADIMVIAGGGGSGYFSNSSVGGGGAGGFRVLTSQSLVSGTNYSATVGAGGAGGNNTSSQGFNGSNSSISGSGFSTITSSGGGGGAGINVISPFTAQNGGSGGGGSNTSQTAGTGNAGGYTPSEGNNGGTGAGNAYSSGGGGGASGVGANGPTSGSTGAAGGVGNSSYSSWGAATSTGQNSGGTYYYAGGGGGGGAGGGAGGLGGGGAGGSLALGTAGTANTGGGAGGGQGSSSGNGVAGGSGLVIVRYAV